MSLIIRKRLLFSANVLRFCSLALQYVNSQKHKRRRSVTPLYKPSARSGFFETKFQKIKAADGEKFHELTRMTVKQFQLLLSLVEDKLVKTSMRMPISPECRLTLALMHLSQGLSCKQLASKFRMGISTARNIIHEVCEVLWNVLSPQYMRPLNELDLDAAADEFDEKWQMPNCVGSVDGKHIQIRHPRNNASEYYYKGYYSIILMAACNANYVFTVVDIGSSGSRSEISLFRLSSFGQKLFNDHLMPLQRNLPNSDKVTPLYFVADNTFPLTTNLMRPYPKVSLNAQKRNFNEQLSKARQVIENAFGVLRARWKVLQSTVEVHPKTAEKVVLACVILHNFVLQNDQSCDQQLYCPPDFTDSYDEQGNVIYGLWRQQIAGLDSIKTTNCGNNSKIEARCIRDTLADFFLIEYDSG